MEPIPTGIPAKKPCWDNGGAEYEWHDYGKHGIDDTCTRCGYEIEQCTVAVYIESVEYGGEWTAREGEAQWCGHSGKRKPTPLADEPRPTTAAAWGPEYRRARIGEWRVFYRIDDDQRTVYVEQDGRARQGGK